MEHLDRLLLNEPTRAALWRQLATIIENHLNHIHEHPVAPPADPAEIRALLEPFDFTEPIDPAEAVERVAGGFRRFLVHTPHPGYYGLFNPAPTTMGIAADALAAAFNPQLAAWNHSPFPVELENHLVRAFGSRFGYDPKHCDGVFASGGAEANHTAVLAALTLGFPEFGRAGLRGLPAQPVMYVSSEGHHSLLKAARLCGLGSDACRIIPVDDKLQMDLAALKSQLRKDRDAKLAPFLIAATAGATSSGVVDPLVDIVPIAEAERCWFHVDATWGGAAALVRELRPLLAGIERADSIAFDVHKWLSVPMGAGLLLTRHPEILTRTFQTATDYMPRETGKVGIVDPYSHSMQWSRRFIGLKVFLSLAVAGWDGYATAIRHMTAMGDLMRRELDGADWKIVNQTKLPLVCFVDSRHTQGGTAEYLDGIAKRVVESGKAWISTTRIGNGQPVLRACVTNYRTTADDVATLVRALKAARDPR